MVGNAVATTLCSTDDRNMPTMRPPMSQRSCVGEMAGVDEGTPPLGASGSVIDPIVAERRGLAVARRP